MPVATVSLNITGFPAEVLRENKNCVANGAMTAWYMLFPISILCVFTCNVLVVSILVCVVPSLVKDCPILVSNIDDFDVLTVFFPDPEFRLQENIVGTRSRVFFNLLDINSNVKAGTFTFPSAGQETCKQITVYVRVRQHT